MKRQLVVGMPSSVQLALTTALAGVLLQGLYAQDLAPRAYVITPLHSNAVTMNYSYSRGEIDFGGVLPATDAAGTINLSTISYYHSLNVAGRSANVTVSLPYALAYFQGDINGAARSEYRSGLMDLVLRFAVNLRGGPAMNSDVFRTWQQKTIVGGSVKVIAPTGQYDPARLINPGAHRWAFKPELGLSRRWGHWVLDGYGAVWLFLANPEYFSQNRSSAGANRRSQAPIGALEAHVSYDVKPRLWASIDANYWYGGRTSVNGVQSRSTLQANSRIGATVSLPLSKHQSLKFSYSHGARIRFGGNTSNVSAAWQYSWLGRPQ